MKKILVALISGVAGIIIGVLLVLFLIGSPKVKPLPGVAVKAPEPGGDPPGTAVVTLDEKFFDSVLGTIFRDLGAPSFPLELTSNHPLDDATLRLTPAAFQGQCQDQVTITNEGSDKKTEVHFANGKISAQLPFTGSKSLFGCLTFKGWAQASINLSFDKEKQTVYGEIIVEGVNVEGVPDMASGLVTRLVQYSINQRINPLTILRAPQLAVAMPVQSTNGTLKAQVNDVRAEIAEGKLILHISYDFAGVRGQQTPPPPQG